MPENIGKIPIFVYKWNRTEYDLNLAYMNKKAIYNNDWLSIHPYKSEQPTDKAYVDIANQLYDACIIDELPQYYKKRLAVYVAAYMEDVKSNLALWGGFTSACMHEYGKLMPFYDISEAYDTFSINMEDVKFIIWNTWQKAEYKHEHIHPQNELIGRQAEVFFGIISEAYDGAECNEYLSCYFDEYKSEEDARGKLQWLFAHTYLTEPSLHAYIDNIKPEDIYEIPTGPMALFLHEWIEFITFSEQWKKVKGLFIVEPEPSAEMKMKNMAMYKNFTKANGGKNIVYLDGYDSLKNFLVDVLKWPDDENHTLPQMKQFHNFILMAEPEKGILLAKNICECIADADNAIYNKEIAGKNAFRLLTEPTVCPPDLLVHCIQNHLLDDAVWPGTDDKDMVRNNADFIARHTLLYYYRGD